jgi:glycosyltransferase involved in cell wall biosynthesis
MKILIIINSLNTNGAEKLIVDTLPKYIEQGLYVELLLLSSHKTKFLTFLEDENIVKIHKLSNKSIYNPIHIFKIAKYLKIFDIVHVHLFPVQYFVPLAKIISRSKAKLIFTEHSTSNRRLRTPFFKLIDKYIYRAYYKVIPITKEIENKLIAHTKLPKNRFVLIENGVDLSKIKLAEPIKAENIYKGITSNHKLIIQASAFREPKDHKTLIMAFTLLPKHYKLLLVGEGEMLNKHIKLVKHLNLEDQVKFLGYRMDVPRLLKSSHVNILSSSYEGLSLYSLESLGSGKPFVASDVPGLTDLVKDYGVLFEKGNYKEVASIIKDLCENKELARTIAVKCIERSKNYDLNLMIKKHINLYNLIYNNPK